MASSTKKKAGQAKSRPLEDMTPSEQVAHEIVQMFADLAPSVDRIMQADLSETQRHRAITSFREALSGGDKLYRDPRYAIAHCGPDDRA